MSHPKGRDCERTEEVLDNYRHRALAAEATVAMVRSMVQGLPDHPWIPGDQGSQWPALLEALGVTTDTVDSDNIEGTVEP